MSCSDSQHALRECNCGHCSADHLMNVLCQMVVFQYFIDEDGVGITQYNHDTPSSSCQLVHNLQRNLFSRHIQLKILDAEHCTLPFGCFSIPSSLYSTLYATVQSVA